MFRTQLHHVLHKQQTVQLIQHQHNIVTSQVVTVPSIHYLTVPQPVRAQAKQAPPHQSLVSWQSLWL